MLEEFQDTVFFVWRILVTHPKTWTYHPLCLFLVVFFIASSSPWRRLLAQDLREKDKRERVTWLSLMTSLMKGLSLIGFVFFWALLKPLFLRVVLSGGFGRLDFQASFIWFHVKISGESRPGNAFTLEGPRPHHPNTPEFFFTHNIRPEVSQNRCLFNLASQDWKRFFS